MEKINKLLSHARNTEVDTVSGRIISEYGKNDWGFDTHLTGIFGLLNPSSIKLSQAIKRIKAESSLEEKDELRDNKLRAVNYVVLGFIHHPDETISSAAKKVDAVFDHYGLNIINESYATESSFIKSLLGDFDSPEIQIAIAAMPGLPQIVDDLKAAQTGFEEAELLFQNEKAKEGSQENATEVKQTVLSLINDKLVTYLNAMVLVDEAKYGSFALTVSQIINDMNLIIKKRKKSSQPVNDAAVN